MVDDGPEIEAAIEHTPFNYSFSTPTRVFYLQPRVYQVASTIVVNKSVLIKGNGGVIVPDLGASGGRVFDVTAGDVVFDGVEFDGKNVQSTSLSGNTYIIRAGHVSNYIEKLEIKNCKFRNLNATDGNNANTSGAPNLLVTHAIYVDKCESLTLANNIVDGVSGAAVFTRNINHIRSHGNTWKNSGWYTFNIDHNVHDWHIIGDNFLCNQKRGIFWGGAINTVNNQGERQNSGGRIHRCYFEGKFSYGGVIRLQSDDGVDVGYNTFGSTGIGAWSIKDQGLTLIRAVTRDPNGSTPSQPCRNIVVHNNTASKGISSGAFRIGVYLSNEWTGGGRNAASHFCVYRNTFSSPDTSNYFDSGISIHGQKGGIDGVHIHDNTLTLKFVRKSIVAGGIGIIGRNVTGKVNGVWLGNNTVTGIEVPSNTYQVGLQIGRNVDRVFQNQRNSFYNLFIGVRTAAGAGPTLERLDNVNTGAVSRPTLFSQQLSRYAAIPN